MPKSSSNPSGRAARWLRVTVAAATMLWTGPALGQTADADDGEAGYLESFPRLYIGAGAGGHLVLSDWDMGELDALSRPVSADSSFFAELRLGLDLSRAWGVELGVGYLPFGASAETNDGLDLAARLRWTFADVGVQPYAVLGGGAYVNLQPDPDGSGAELVPQGHVGVGIAPRLSRMLRLRVEARYQISRTLEDGDAPFASNVALVAGLDLLFGTEARPEPPVVVPPAPPADTDGDGIVDDDDGCPRQPEDRDGFQDEDGCPDPDNDGDGIVDGDDACPNEPEKVNQFEDEDGCPDALPDAVPCASITIDQTVHFATASAALRASDAAILDAIAKTLTDRRDLLKVLIVGHADARGAEANNLELSRQRALTVQQALVERGVAASRLAVEYAGETKPVATGESPSSWAANRRAEFRIIEIDRDAECPNPLTTTPGGAR